MMINEDEIKQMKLFWSMCVLLDDTFFRMEKFPLSYFNFNFFFDNNNDDDDDE